MKQCDILQKSQSLETSRAQAYLKFWLLARNTLSDDYLVLKHTEVGRFSFFSNFCLVSHTPILFYTGTLLYRTEKARFWSSSILRLDCIPLQMLDQFGGVRLGNSDGEYETLCIHVLSVPSGPWSS